MMTVTARLVGADELISNLKKLATNSGDSLSEITDRMAKSTQRSAKNILGVHRNSGELEDSIVVTTKRSSRKSTSTVSTNSAYAKYVEFGTEGSWTTSMYARTISVTKMAKYPAIPIVYVGNAHTPSYAFHGQEPKLFMTNAFEATVSSNQSFAKSKYIEYIMKGMR